MSVLLCCRVVYCGQRKWSTIIAGVVLQMSSTNHLLTALAIADLLTMISYLPYAFYFYCVTIPDERYAHTRWWVVYLVFNTYFTITTHTAAMWLTVSLAIFRYIFVCCQPSVGSKMCSLRRAKVCLILLCRTSGLAYILKGNVEIGGGEWYLALENSMSETFRNKTILHNIFIISVDVSVCCIVNNNTRVCGDTHLLLSTLHQTPSCTSSTWCWSRSWTTYANARRRCRQWWDWILVQRYRLHVNNCRHHQLLAVWSCT